MMSEKNNRVRITHQAAVDQIAPDYFLPEQMKLIERYLQVITGGVADEIEAVLEVYIPNTKHVAVYAPFSSKDVFRGHGGYMLETPVEDLVKERNKMLGDI